MLTNILIFVAICCNARADVTIEFEKECECHKCKPSWSWELPVSGCKNEKELYKEKIFLSCSKMNEQSPKRVLHCRKNSHPLYDSEINCNVISHTPNNMPHSVTSTPLEKTKGNAGNLDSSPSTGSPVETWSPEPGSIGCDAPGNDCPGTIGFFVCSLIINVILFALVIALFVKLQNEKQCRLGQQSTQDQVGNREEMEEINPLYGNIITMNRVHINQTTSA